MFYWGINIDNIFLSEKYEEPNMFTLCVHYQYWKSFNQMNFNICPECGDLIPSVTLKERQILNSVFKLKDGNYYYNEYKILVKNNMENNKYIVVIDCVNPQNTQEISKIVNKLNDLEVELNFLGISCYGGIFEI